jgi:hypothetical protein
MVDEEKRVCERVLVFLHRPPFFLKKKKKRKGHVAVKDFYGSKDI